MERLNQYTLSALPDFFQRPQSRINTCQILHFGIGGFHRSHQAYAIDQLIRLNPDRYKEWGIIGVGLMPSDENIVKNFREQDHLYTLKTVSHDSQENYRVIDAIQEMLYAKTDMDRIVERIAAPETKVISFTITEGGYLMDYENHRFKMDNPNVKNDLQNQDNPQTIFGILAKGLQQRMKDDRTGVVLLSCDNIQENGAILRFALFAFLEQYDQELKHWVEKNVVFPNSMVDRITPVTAESEKQAFEEQFELSDQCLVVSEDYFQWVIENQVTAIDFPPLDQVGVSFVTEVLPYETMKLGILNAGHSLVGFMGELLGYDRIHHAVKDPLIRQLFDRFVQEEVIPVLEPIADVDYTIYYAQVKERFGNAMINDSTARIISGSSDKIPKFLLATIRKQLSRTSPHIQVSISVIVAWWMYLRHEKEKNDMEGVQDNLKNELSLLFESNDPIDFIQYTSIFGDLVENRLFVEGFMTQVQELKGGTTMEWLEQFVKDRDGE